MNHRQAIAYRLLLVSAFALLAALIVAAVRGHQIPDPSPAGTGQGYRLTYGTDLPPGPPTLTVVR